MTTCMEDEKTVLDLPMRDKDEEKGIYVKLSEGLEKGKESEQEKEEKEAEASSCLVKPKQIRNTRHRWSVPEENALVSAWLNTSKNATVGNDQRGGTFWNRVAAYYAAIPAVSNLVMRESNTCKQKWAKINDSVSKFAGCYDYASRQISSGQSEDDVMELAYKLYFQDRKVKFSLEHVWRSLRNDPKWCSLTTPENCKSNKRTKLHDTIGHSSSSNTASHVEEETLERPIGVKAAKEKGKKRGKDGTEERDKSSLNELSEMWKFKEKNLAAKERLSRQKILDNLMLKTDPLTDLEQNLKIKLMSDMFEGTG